MRKRLLLGLLALVVLAPLGGLVAKWATGPGHRIGREAFDALEEGMTREQVEVLLGPEGDYTTGSVTYASDLVTLLALAPRPPDEAVAAWRGDRGAVLVWYDGRGRVTHKAFSTAASWTFDARTLARRWLGL